MQEREIADLERQLERVRVVARKRSIVEVAEHSTGVINKPHPLFIIRLYRILRLLYKCLCIPNYKKAL